ncbi:hypothetical protein GPECTOR_54g189 [Gonium pectorale]|uniref:Uncharacterized protein n=1 Tax=Gonium pectorale TaxID=33097 RepID=A0A150G6I6_GONPE|nr:hypothetical protein GPECTOR_54g189 [Gonium pectorale]|eukprot:KXZ45448.1 hypothetical protein GPECTOR_54g189 [Gonium pectorale]
MSGGKGAQQPPPPLVVALVATCGRPRLLWRRCIPSILRQTRPPAAIILVDDSRDPGMQGHNTSQANLHNCLLPAVGAPVAGQATAPPRPPRIFHVGNALTPGASGAWNTGLLLLAESVTHGSLLLRGAAPCTSAAGAGAGAPGAQELLVEELSAALRCGCGGVGAAATSPPRQVAGRRGGVVAGGLHNTWVAILDDDDAWEPNHLEACLAAAAAAAAASHQPAADMVVSGLLRYEHDGEDGCDGTYDDGGGGGSTSPAGHPAGASAAARLTSFPLATQQLPPQPVPQPVPPEGPLDARCFLTDNPGIQGSNLFVRLGTLLRAGLFDEWLPSTTDRDLCIRLAHVRARSAHTGLHTVRHFAPPGQPAATATVAAAVYLATTMTPFAATPGAVSGGGGDGGVSGFAVRPRLSHRGSAAKRLGLRRFYAKWRPDMTADEAARFRARAWGLFGVAIHDEDLSALADPDADPEDEQAAAAAETEAVAVAEADAVAAAASELSCALGSAEASGPPDGPLPAASTAGGDGTKAAGAATAEAAAGEVRKPQATPPPADVGMAGAVPAPGLAYAPRPPSQLPPSSPPPPPPPPLLLVAGVATHEPATLAPLLGDLAELRAAAGDELLGGLAVLVLENGHGNGNDSGGGGSMGRELEVLASEARDKGLLVLCYSRGFQLELCRAVLATAAAAADTSSASPTMAAVAAAGLGAASAAAGPLPGPLLPLDVARAVVAAAAASGPAATLPIGVTRTLLQHLLHWFVETEVPPRLRGSAVAWVLDDDKRLPRLPRLPGPAHRCARHCCARPARTAAPAAAAAAAATTAPAAAAQGVTSCRPSPQPARLSATSGDAAPPHEAQPKVDPGFLAVLQQLRHAPGAGAGPPDVVLGADSGAPPLPAASCSRLALLDLATALRRHAATYRSAAAAAGAGAAAPPPGAAAAAPTADSAAAAAATAFNGWAKARWPEHYYDLSTAHSDHLEVPLMLPPPPPLLLPAPPLLPASPGMERPFAVVGVPTSGWVPGIGGSGCDSATGGAGGTVDGSSTDGSASGGASGRAGDGDPVLGLLADAAHSLLSGAPFLRGLLPPAQDPFSPPPSPGPPRPAALPSLHRGGSTFVFQPAALRMPQQAFACRRSDMLWCVALRAAGLRVVRCAELAVEHHRAAAEWRPRESSVRVPEKPVFPDPIPDPSTTASNLAVRAAAAAAVTAAPGCGRESDGGCASYADGGAAAATGEVPDVAHGAPPPPAARASRGSSAMGLTQGSSGCPDDDGAGGLPGAALPPFFAKLVGDCEGHALYRALQDATAAAAAGHGQHATPASTAAPAAATAATAASAGNRRDTFPVDGAPSGAGAGGRDDGRGACGVGGGSGEPGGTAAAELLAGFLAHLRRRAVQVLRSFTRAAGLVDQVRASLERLDLGVGLEPPLPPPPPPCADPPGRNAPALAAVDAMSPSASASWVAAAEEQGDRPAAAGAAGAGAEADAAAPGAADRAAALRSLRAACDELEALYGSTANLDALMARLLLRDQQRDEGIVRAVLRQAPRHVSAAEQALGPASSCDLKPPEPATLPGASDGATTALANAPDASRPMLAQHFGDCLAHCGRAAASRLAGVPASGAAALVCVGRGQEGCVLAWPDGFPAGGDGGGGSSGCGGEGGGRDGGCGDDGGGGRDGGGGPLFKYMWHVAARVAQQPPGRRAFLRDLPRRLSTSPGRCLYRVTKWLDDGPAALAVYGKYELRGVVLSSLVDADGGDGDGHMCDGGLLLRLARECLAAGVALGNIHPRNMILLPPPPPGHSESPAPSAEAAVPQPPLPFSSAGVGPPASAADAAGPLAAVRRRSAELRFIDVGCDWGPATAADVDRMLKRLYVCWRWWRREDLPRLLTATLAEDAADVLPELTGYRRFRTAVYGGYDAPEATLMPYVLRTARARDSFPNPRSRPSGTVAAPPGLDRPTYVAAVLDYGAGDRAKLLAALDAELPPGVALVGCDPWVGRPSRWSPEAAEAAGRCCARWTPDCGAAALMHAYDVVVCTLVLCVLEKRREYLRALSDLAAALRPPTAAPPRPTAREHQRASCPHSDDDSANCGGGVLVLAVCNPFFTHHGHTVLQERDPGGASDDCAPVGAAAAAGGCGALDGRTAGDGGDPRGGCEDGGGGGGAFDYWRCVAWTKRLRSWPLPGLHKRAKQVSGGGAEEAYGAVRRDVHRPLEALLLDLARVGLQLISLEQTEALDPAFLDQPASDFMLLTLRRVGNPPPPAPPPPPSRPRPLSPIQPAASPAPSTASRGADSGAAAAPSAGTATAAVRSPGVTSASAATGEASLTPDPAPGPAAAAAGDPRVGLLIKACALDHERIRQQVLHLTSQLTDPELPFAVVAVAMDPHPGPFARQHCPPDATALLRELRLLQRLGVIDEVLRGSPAGSPEVLALNERWFGLRGCAASHSAEGSPTSSALQALELLHSARHACDLVLQVDCDMVVFHTASASAATAAAGRGAAGPAAAPARGARGYLRRMVDLLRADPAAVTVALDALPAWPREEGGAPSPLPPPPPGATFCGVGGPWRVEVRGCLLHLPRLMALLPLPVSPPPPSSLAPPTPPSCLSRHVASGAAVSAAGGACHSTAAPEGKGDMPGSGITTATTAVNATTASIVTTVAAATAAAAASALAPPRWYRALDAAVAQSRGGVRSYRGACAGLLAAVHPPNATVKALPPDAVPLRPPPSPAKGGASGADGGDIGDPHAGVLWDVLYAAAAYGRWPAAAQGCRMDVAGGAAEWSAAALARREELVVVVCGRNDIDPRRVGVVVVDDASDRGACGQYMEALCRRMLPPAWATQVAFVRFTRRRRVLANTDWAVRHLVASPQAVVVTLDADDCLASPAALSAVAAAHRGTAPSQPPPSPSPPSARQGVGLGRGQGRGGNTRATAATPAALNGGSGATGRRSAACASFGRAGGAAVAGAAKGGGGGGGGGHDEPHDVVIAGQLRTDRTDDPAASGFGTARVVFGGPARQRALRGGGEATGWFRDLANDWAFMVPIAEMAAAPAVLPAPLYLYEPSRRACPPAALREAREPAICAIMALPPYCPAHGAACVCRHGQRRNHERSGGSGGGEGSGDGGDGGGGGDGSDARAATAAFSTACPLVLGRRPLVAVVGDANLAAERVADRQEKARLAFEVGRLLVEAGCRVLTGGEGGVMEAACRGARAAAAYCDGDCVALLRGAREPNQLGGEGQQPPTVNRFIDVPVATGMGEMRNALIGAAADAVVAVGGGPGTLSELSFAWMARAAAVVALTGVGGLSGELAGRRLDGRPPVGRRVAGAGSAAEAVAAVVAALRGAGLLLR